MLKVNNLNVFINRHQIIHNVSLQVPSGAIVGLVGPNGAGKTTIMKTILGLTKFNGTISINDEQVTENNHTALKKVGALIEHPAIYPFLTGQQNLELYSTDPDDLKKVVTMLGMNKYINSKSSGYSLGMKQKLGIAIALLNHPEFVILDEPMNGLDVEATILIRKIIKRYAENGTSFLISSHVLSELQKIMTHVVLINNGATIVNQSVADFNHVSRKQYRLIPENRAETIQILSDHKIPFQLHEDSLLINRSDCFEIQDVLAENHLHLEEIAPLEDSFEQIIVHLLEQQRGDRHEKEPA